MRFFFLFFKSPTLITLKGSAIKKNEAESRLITKGTQRTYKRAPRVIRARMGGANDSTWEEPALKVSDLSGHFILPRTIK